jgi:hypothetical protein
VQRAVGGLAAKSWVAPDRVTCATVPPNAGWQRDKPALVTHTHRSPAQHGLTSQESDGSGSDCKIQVSFVIRIDRRSDNRRRPRHDQVAIFCAWGKLRTAGLLLR